MISVDVRRSVLGVPVQVGSFRLGLYDVDSIGLLAIRRRIIDRSRTCMKSKLDHLFMSTEYF